MSNNATTVKKLQLEIIEPIIQDLLLHYDSEEVETMWRLILQDRPNRVKKEKNQGNNNIVFAKQSKVKPQETQPI
jgi:hypothetical protein